MGEWRWKWSGKSEKSSSRRVYYKAVTRTDRKDKNFSQTFRVGDTVCMRGEESETWVAHLLELFQVNEDDKILREALDSDTVPDSKKKDVLMRCTLRWFYGASDISKRSITSSAFGKSLPNEVYFSDYVERDGFNDVQVLEGLTWLFPSQDKLKDFERHPSQNYNSTYDILRITRAFVNNHDGDEPVRKLEKKELNYLLSTPTKDQDMYSKSYLVMTGRHLRKETTKVTPKKSKAVQPPSPPSDDGSYSAPPSASSASSSSSDSESSSLEGRAAPANPRGSANTLSQRKQGRSHTGRRKVKFTREECDDGSDYEPENKEKRNTQRRLSEERRKKAEAREKAETRKMQAKTLRKRLFQDLNTAKRAEKQTIEGNDREDLSEANREVLDMVSELNESAQLDSQNMRKGPLDGLVGSTSRRKKRDSTKPRPRPLRPGEDHLRKLRTGAAAKEKHTTICINSDEDDEQEGERLHDDGDGDGTGTDDEDDIPIVASANKQTRSSVDKQGSKASTSNSRAVLIGIEKPSPSPHVASKRPHVEQSSSVKRTSDKRGAATDAATTRGSVFMPTARKSDLASKTSRQRSERVKRDVATKDMMDVEPMVAHTKESTPKNGLASARPNATAKMPSLPEDMVVEIQALDRLFDKLSTDEQKVLQSNSEFLIGVATVKFDEQLSKNRGQLDERAEYSFAKEVGEALMRESNTKGPGFGQ